MYLILMGLKIHQTDTFIGKKIYKNHFKLKRSEHFCPQLEDHFFTISLYWYFFLLLKNSTYASAYHRHLSLAGNINCKSNLVHERQLSCFNVKSEKPTTRKMFLTRYLNEDILRVAGTSKKFHNQQGQSSSSTSTHPSWPVPLINRINRFSSCEIESQLGDVKKKEG